MGNGQGQDHTLRSGPRDTDHVILADSLHAEIRDFAALQWPEEACGLLVADQSSPNRITRVVFAKNVAEQPQTTFEIDPQTLINTYRSARKKNEIVVGCFHSHPNGKALPSTTDRERADEDGFLWLIIATDHSGVVADGMYCVIHQQQDQSPDSVVRYFRRCRFVFEPEQ